MVVFGGHMEASEDGPSLVFPFKRVYAIPIKQKEVSCVKCSGDSEDLRRKLLDDIYAGAVCGMGAMLLEEDEIREADDKELEEIAQRHGF